ncbi:MAG TPA: 16S rRNA (uracil(1498)-N(3))-methyltransferase [Spirochaetia bacterium]|nr:16S rRNA (uracil(1498)-N(3))-methyltransferase [Spirochaetia bacterium]
MAHFFVAPHDLDETGGTAVVTGPDAFHIIKVLRLFPGAQITLADGSGRIYAAQIAGLSRDAVDCRLLGPAGREEMPLKTTLVQGIPKGDKMDLVVQKAVEIGVSRIVPLLSLRTVARPQGEQKLLRWRRIALEAAKQSRRGVVPEVDHPRTMEEVLDLLKPDGVALVPWEQESGEGLGEVLAGEPPGEVFILIGPEGGFAAAEVALAQSRGVRPVSLGRRILRSETAGIVTLALVLFKWGDLGWATKESGG